MNTAQYKSISEWYDLDLLYFRIQKINFKTLS